MSPDAHSHTTIQRATSVDREHIIRLLAAQFTEHNIELHSDQLAQAVDGFFDDPRRGQILVARQEFQIVGVAVLSYIWTLEHGGKSCWLDELYVLPDFRVHGIGTMLLRAAIEFTTADDCIAMDLEVESGHERAANLYLREGFRPHTRSRYVRLLRENREIRD